MIEESNWRFFLHATSHHCAFVYLCTCLPLYLQFVSICRCAKSWHAQLLFCTAGQWRRDPFNEAKGGKRFVCIFDFFLWRICLSICIPTLVTYWIMMSFRAIDTWQQKGRSQKIYWVHFLHVDFYVLSVFVISFHSIYNL